MCGLSIQEYHYYLCRGLSSYFTLNSTTTYVGAFVIFHPFSKKDITHNHTRLFKTYPEEEYFHTVHKSSISYDTHNVFVFQKLNIFCFTVVSSHTHQIFKFHVSRILFLHHIFLHPFRSMQNLIYSIV